MLLVYLDNVLIIQCATDTGSGPMGYGLQAGLSNITSVNLGSLDTIPPNPVPAASVGIGAYANHVDLQWPQTTDDPNGTGVYEYRIHPVNPTSLNSANGRIVGT